MQQNVAGFRRGLFICFLGHTPLLPAFWATPHYNSDKEPMIALLTAIWLSTVVVPNFVPFEPPAILAPPVVEHPLLVTKNTKQ